MCLLLLLGVDRIHEQLVYRDVERRRAVGEIRLALATAHLWVEELVTGDEVPAGEIAFRLDRAATLTSVLLGGVGAAAPADAGLRQGLSDLRSRISEFRELSEIRQRDHAAGRNVGIGSEMDQNYDALYREAQGTAERLGDLLAAREVSNRTRARFLLRTIFVAWAGLVALAVVGLWHRQRRQRRAEAALRAREAQLHVAQKMDAIGRLAGGIAHDINSYLGAIRAQGELTRAKAGGDERLIRRMDSIVRTVDKASALIARLLAFSKQQPIVPRAIRLNRVIREGIDTFVGRLVGERIELATRLETTLWTVEIDPSQIEQIVVNLVINARDAMPSGGRVTIETANRRIGPEDVVATTPALRTGEYVTLGVSDEGSGIPAELREKIFEPFFSTKQDGGNSGLGLATVYGIVEQYHGAIEVDSEPGRGTTIRIYLPRSLAEVGGEKAAVPTTRPRRPAGRILVVDDNDELRSSIRAVLEALGYRVAVAASGEEALAIFDRIGPEIELTVTDVVMRGMNGRELAEGLRRRGGDPKVLFVSGYTDDVLLRYGIATGKEAFLKKPFTAGDLAAKIRQMLEISV